MLEQGPRNLKKEKKKKGSEVKEMREDRDQEILYQHTPCVIYS